MVLKPGNVLLRRHGIATVVSVCLLIIVLAALTISALISQNIVQAQPGTPNASPVPMTTLATSDPVTICLTPESGRRSAPLTATAIGSIGQQVTMYGHLTFIIMDSFQPITPGKPYTPGKVVYFLVETNGNMTELAFDNDVMAASIPSDWLIVSGQLVQASNAPNAEAVLQVTSMRPFIPATETPTYNGCA